MWKLSSTPGIPSRIMTTSTHIAVYALFTRGEEILLGRRKNTGRWDGYLSPPCGRLEVGESVRSGMIREIAEETQAKVEPDDLVLTHVRHRVEGWSRLQFYFRVTAWDGEIFNAEPGLCEGWEWFPMEDLPRDVVPHSAQVLGLCRRGVRYSEEGW